MGTAPPTDRRTRWGRTRFAQGRLGAMAVAVPAGVVLAAAGVAVAVGADVVDGSRPVLLAALVVTGTALDARWALVGVLAVASLSLVVRYQIAKARG